MEYIGVAMGYSVQKKQKKKKEKKNFIGPIYLIFINYISPPSKKKNKNKK